VIFFGGFLFALHNLFWYYEIETREHFEISHHTLPNKTTPFITKAEESFGT
jgi:hypothetical protein